MSQKNNSDNRNARAPTKGRSGRKKKSSFTNPRGVDYVRKLVKLEQQVREQNRRELSLSPRRGQTEEKIGWSITTREAARSFLGDYVYKFETGSWSRFNSTGASIMNLVDVGSALFLSCILTSTTAPELTFLSGLFDEIKVEGITVHYEPFNPYNRGATVNSDSVGFFWDDDTSAPGSFTTPAEFGALSHRRPLFEMWSLDHSHTLTFKRPNPISEYPWSDVASMGNQTSTQGALAWVADGVNSITPSIHYGSLWYAFHIMLRARF